MAEIIKINDRISYIGASRSPLSADVGIIEGDEFFWIFDVGADESVPTALNALNRPKKAVISHFHPDHMGNLDRIGFAEIYLGANTFGYAKRGTVVEKDIYIDDGIKIHIFPLPSSHAKGSVGLEAGDYAFLGDGTYAAMKKGKVCYNASVLKEEITVLKGLSAEYFLLSHDEKFIRKREDVIAELEKIYAKRNPKEAYIFV